MTDDIVTRLREAAKYVETDGNTWAADDCREAADEIELLRADRDKWKSLAIEIDNIAQIQAGIYPPIPHYEVKK